MKNVALFQITQCDEHNYGLHYETPPYFVNVEAQIKLKTLYFKFDFAITSEKYNINGIIKYFCKK